MYFHAYRTIKKKLLFRFNVVNYKNIFTYTYILLIQKNRKRYF